MMQNQYLRIITPQILHFLMSSVQPNLYTVSVCMNLSKCFYTCQNSCSILLLGFFGMLSTMKTT